VNTTTKTVTFHNENESVAATLPYTNLILAPGAHPRRLPIPGGDLSNVYTLRYLEDAQKIDAACQPGTTVVVIGTSFISMEVAGTISKRGMKSIDMVGMEEVPFETILGKEVGAGLQVVRYLCFHIYVENSFFDFHER
jgi:NAD(P)H-nitrite reductase large subunit